MLLEIKRLKRSFLFGIPGISFSLTFSIAYVQFFFVNDDHIVPFS